MKVAVIGAGTMGSGIAQTCALAGNQVSLYDASNAARDKAPKIIASSLARLVKKAHISEAEQRDTLARITLLAELDDVDSASVIIEAVFEDISVKREVWQTLSALANQNALLATNTSSLSVTELAALVDQPERFCGLHFFNPVPVLPLVEVIKALQTSDETIRSAEAFITSIGKTPVVCQDKPGFIVNRLLIPYMNDAVHALAEGVASAENIDKAMKLGANMPLGPLALTDLVGLDVALAATESLYREFGDPKFRPAPLLKQMVRAGKLGRKSGQGFYRYDAS